MCHRKEMLQIRPCTLDSLEEIVNLENLSFPDPWNKNMFRSDITSKHIELLGLWMKEDLIGYISIMILDDEASINNLAISPYQRGKGFGHYLMENVLSYLKAKKVIKIVLEVRVGNKAAISLYEHHGFRVVHTIPDYYKQPMENAHVMIKEMTQVD